MPNTTLNPDALRMEESFFAEENAKLLERLRKEARTKQRRDALREALNIDDEGVLDALVELDLYPETAAAFSLIPLLEVAWADGHVNEREREAILKAAAQRGIEEGSTTYELLGNWLQRKPGPEMLETWKGYVKALVERMNLEQRVTFRTGVLTLARGVAEAAGGFLGFGSKISAVEQRALDDLDATFG